MLRALTSATCVGLIAYAAVAPTLPSLTGPPAALKPFRTFEEFYPFYLSEHLDPINRSLHFVFGIVLCLSSQCSGTSIIVAIMLLNLPLVLSVVAAGSVGCVLSAVLQGQSNGFLEAAILMLTYLLLSAGLGKKPRVVCLLSVACLILKAALLIAIGYSFAWVGHFFFELNKPASFIYVCASICSNWLIRSRPTV
jgi:hypothetical protein